MDEFDAVNQNIDDASSNEVVQSMRGPETKTVLHCKTLDENDTSIVRSYLIIHE